MGHMAVWATVYIYCHMLIGHDSCLHNNRIPNILTSLQLDKEARISPGEMTENEFIKELTGANRGYLLPQYVTGLLLSRNVKIQFRGIKANTAAHAVRVLTSTRLSGGFGPWRASTSFNYARSNRQFRSESSSNGLRITIPGAQVIGYYTQVMPKFPK